MRMQILLKTDKPDWTVSTTNKTLLKTAAPKLGSAKMKREPYKVTVKED